MKKLLRRLMGQWVYRLGLSWWTVESYYHTGKEARKYFKTKDQYTTVLARTFSDWRYAQATVHFNVPAIKGMSEDEVERTVVHELCHILINEMREGGIDHEERTVTGLTKAFMWVKALSDKEQEGVDG